MDKDDAESLCRHIEGHLGFAREAIAADNAAALKQQAAEIEGWAQSLKEIAERGVRIPRGQ